MARAPFGTSYFGEISDRLRRFLGLDGEFPVSIEQRVQPVIVVGNAMEPGLNPFIGRRWAGQLQGGGVTGATIEATTPRGLLIDRIIFSASVTAEYQLRFGNFGTPGTVTGQIIDGATATGEVPGAKFQNVAIGTSVSVGSFFLLANTVVQLDLGLYLANGMGLQFFPVSGAGNIRGIVLGRVATEL